MMRDMRRIDLQDELQEGFEVSAMPPVGPDGAPTLPPLRTDRPAHPRLCEAGPCRNYHRLVVQVEAADPMAETRPGGEVVQAPRSFHVQTHHYCYPTIGIEMPLGELPVIECNRFEPRVPRSSASCASPSVFYDADAVEHFWRTPAGAAHLAAVACWEAERAREVAADAAESARETEESEEAARLIAGSLTIDDSKGTP